MGAKVKKEKNKTKHNDNGERLLTTYFLPDPGEVNREDEGDEGRVWPFPASDHRSSFPSTPGPEE